MLVNFTGNKTLKFKLFPTACYLGTNKFNLFRTNVAYMRLEHLVGLGGRIREFATVVHCTRTLLLYYF